MVKLLAPSPKQSSSSTLEQKVLRSFEISKTIYQSLQQTNFHRLSATYRDPVVVLIASVVLSAEPDDRVRPVLIPQQHFVVLTLVHLGLVPVCGVPILERDNTAQLHQTYLSYYKIIILYIFN